MEAPGAAWTALVLGAILFGGGVALLVNPAVPDGAATACADERFCAPGGQLPTEGLQAGTGVMLAWAALGMALVMDVLFLGLTRGATVLT